jgi:hypothetical protein
MSDTRTCLNDTTCQQYDRQAGHAWPTSKPLCDACLDHAEPAITGLVYDYLDLAQLHEASMSQAINEKTSGGGHESPILIAGNVEALQAEIVHVTTTWEHALRAVCQLSNPGTFAPLWRTTVYDHLNLTTRAASLRSARAGALVQRAVGIITPRLSLLAGLPAVTVCPTGIEDEPTLVHGWEAIQHLQHLHRQARSVLGRTIRSFFIPGDCWQCGARPTDGVDGPLGRTEPRCEGDPMQVHCTRCTAVRPYADYEHMQQHLMWPGQATDSLVRIAA